MGRLFGGGWCLGKGVLRLAIKRTVELHGGGVGICPAVAESARLLEFLLPVNQIGR